MDVRMLERFNLIYSHKMLNLLSSVMEYKNVEIIMEIILRNSYLRINI